MEKLTFKSLGLSSRSGIFVSVCIIIYIISELLYWVLYSGNMLNLSESEAFRASLLRIVGQISLFCGMGALIIFCVRGIRLDGFSIQKIFALIICIVACLGIALASFATSKTLRNISEVFTFSEQEKKMEERLLSEDNPEIYSKLSRQIAESKFMSDGTIIEYTKEDGQVAMYEPNEEIRKTYEDIHKTRFLLFENVPKSLYVTGYIWIGVVLVGMILGFILPKSSRVYKI